MNALRDLQLFVRVARANSLSEVARATDSNPATVSATIKRLETELGAKLFVRSTRNLRLTAEGEIFLLQCEQGLALITNACENLAAGNGIINGLIQLSVPSDLGRNLIIGWLHEFRQQYPDVQIRLQASDRLAGIYREQVDVALRYGEPPDSALVALPVAQDNRRVLCASPGYLQAHGSPTTPDQLKQHNCLCFMLNDRQHHAWVFSRDDTSIQVDVSGSFQCDDGDIVRRLAILGEGIAYKSYLDVAEDLHQGRLVRLCQDWLGEPAPLYLICADRLHLRPAVRLLREFLMQRCEQDI